MKNFLRALKHTWKYRTGLLLSILCAFVAAAFWGLNFTAIYPVMKILGNNMTLQQWVDQRLDQIQKDLDTQQAEIKRLHLEIEQTELEKDLTSQRLDQNRKDLDVQPEKTKQLQLQVDQSELEKDLRYRDRELKRLAGELAKRESSADTLSSLNWRYHQLRHYFIRFLPPDRFQTLACLLFLVLLGVALKGVFEFCQEYLVGTVMNCSLYDLRNRFYRHALHQDLKQFQEKGSAELMARFTNDMEILGNGIKILYGRVIAEPLRAMACIVLACWISWQLTLLFLVLIPVALYCMTKASRMMKRATRRVLERMSSIYKILQETFHGIRIVKSFTMEPYERRRFEEATRDYSRKSMRVVTIDAVTGPIVEVFGVGAVIIALLAGSYLVLNQKTHLFTMRMTNAPIEMETLLQLFTLLAATADPVRKLSSVYTKLQSAAAAADRIFAYLDQHPEVKANSDGVRVPRHSKAIEFRNVCFSYNAGQPILENITAKVHFGETIAIVGSNGSGKSTLLSLLPRFFDPDHGSILIDGIDIRKANLRSLRKQIGIVTQDAILFDDTIYNNIAYGNRSASTEAIEVAAKKAFAHDFIQQKLANGYQSIAGEVGKNLSGGEKQRIVLARAILRDPSILILDEFTSQIDPVDEALIHQAVKEFKKNRTTFIITHKMYTLEIADRIIVLNNGHIDAIGTHEELIARCATYQRLFDAHQRRVA